MKIKLNEDFKKRILLHHSRDIFFRDLGQGIDSIFDVIPTDTKHEYIAKGSKGWYVFEDWNFIVIED